MRWVMVLVLGAACSGARDMPEEFVFGEAWSLDGEAVELVDGDARCGGPGAAEMDLFDADGEVAATVSIVDGVVLEGTALGGPAFTVLDNWATFGAGFVDAQVTLRRVDDDGAPGASDTTARFLLLCE